MAIERVNVSLGSRALKLASTLALLALGTLLTQCGEGARTVACSNDSDCTDLGGDFRYCASRRCVECVTSASCGPHKRCAEGACVER